MNDQEENAKPTIAERYGVAIGYGATGGIVLAAALQTHRLGAVLLRLQAEYDGVRADLERAGLIRTRNVDRARELVREAEAFEREAVKAAKDHQAPEEAALLRKAKRLRADAEAMPERTPGEIVSARAFILLELKTLVEAKQRVGTLALQMSANRKRPLDTEVVLKLAGHVLDVFLDPGCHQCDGVGKTGSAYLGEVEKQCQVCRGSGHRRDIIGRGIDQVTFCAVLLGELQRQVGHAARGMSQALRSDEWVNLEADATTELHAEVLAMRARLVLLRSQQAESESATLAPVSAVPPVPVMTGPGNSPGDRPEAPQGHVSAAAACSNDQSADGGQ